MTEDNHTKTTRELPGNFGPIKGANGNARVTGPCGDTMEFWVDIQDKRLQRISYTTDGCLQSIICGSIAASMSTGSEISVIQNLKEKDILQAAKNVSQESKHCMLLAVNTLNAAINNYLRAETDTEVTQKGISNDR